MAAAFGFVVFLIAIAVLPLLCCRLPAMLAPERAFPMSPQGDLSWVVHRDRARHSGMMLQSLSSTGVVDFQLHGTFGLGISTDVFPEVRLDFEGGASLLFGPQDYSSSSLMDGAVEWCLEFLRNEGYGFPILGDLVMQNKMFVYDLAAQRIGWVDHNCSMPPNVSTVDMANIGHDNAGGHRRRSISLRAAPDWTLLLWIMVLLPLDEDDSSRFDDTVPMVRRKA